MIGFEFWKYYKLPKKGVWDNSNTFTPLYRIKFLKCSIILWSSFHMKKKDCAILILTLWVCCTKSCRILLYNRISYTTKHILFVIKGSKFFLLTSHHSTFWPLDKNIMSNMVGKAPFKIHMRPYTKQDTKSVHLYE